MNTVSKLSAGRIETQVDAFYLTALWYYPCIAYKVFLCYRTVSCCPPQASSLPPSSRGWTFRLTGFWVVVIVCMAVKLLPSHWKCGRLCFDRRVFIYLYACYSHNSNSIKPNRMKFGGMIGSYPGTIWFDFAIDQVKGQGQGHEKVKIFFLP